MTRQPTMVSLVEEYLAHRRQLGFALRIDGHQLLAFGRYADASGHRGPLTVALALRWAQQSDRAQLPGRRLEVLRGFAKYRHAFDPRTEIPPTGLLGPAHRRLTPYIYSDPELRALSRAAAGLPPPGGLRGATYATLFSLLAATGLRISEALALTRADVDLQRGILTITATKFRKSRLVPLHRSACRALCQYAERRDRYHPQPAAPFFGTPMASPSRTPPSRRPSLDCGTSSGGHRTLTGGSLGCTTCGTASSAAAFCAGIERTPTSTAWW